MPLPTSTLSLFDLTLIDKFKIADEVFKRFKVVEFPLTYVGLSTRMELDVEVDLDCAAYLKTMVGDSLMRFEEAHQISASHRAFEIEQKDNHTLFVTFKPTQECISKATNIKKHDNRFIFDLRLIKIIGIHSGNSESSLEIGRFYICGQFEYCSITHLPEIVDYGEVIMKTKVTKDIHIKNHSKSTTAKLEFYRMTGFEVTPEKFTLLPSRSKRISLSVKPTSLKIESKLLFKIRNSHIMAATCNDISDENFLKYIVDTKLDIIYNIQPRVIQVESLKKLNDKSPNYTYLGKELKIHMQRKETASKLLQLSKTLHAKKPELKRFRIGKDKCNTKIFPLVHANYNICEKPEKKIHIYDLIDINIEPPLLEFGRIQHMTYGEKDVTVINKTNFKIDLKFLNDECVRYTNDKLPTFHFIVKPFAETVVSIFCLGFVEGSYRGTFEFVVDNKYYNYHPYTLQVGNTRLLVRERILKFGMVTNENFIMSIPVTIYNYFNINADYFWNVTQADTPYEFIPKCGSIPKHDCRICDIVYISKITKSKSHDVEVTCKNTLKPVALELTVMTRKVSVKFLQPAVLFKDVALNLKISEDVRLENSSREVAIFNVMEPLIPGLKMEPMSGVIGPKSIITFKITVRMSCILEFTMEINVKINNKEDLILPVSGNIVEPKLTIQPKNLYIGRIPANMITYVPLNFQNTSHQRTVVEVADTNNNCFKVYIANGIEKQRITIFFLEGKQSKTVFVKVYDTYRREIDTFIPFKINGILGPPTEDPLTLEMKYYINDNKQYYENNPRVKLREVHKDIGYFRISGVISLPWIEFSVNKFEINFTEHGENAIEFTMTNVSKCYIYVTIAIAKLYPNFSLNLCTELEHAIVNDLNIKFELDIEEKVTLNLIFHPKGHGKFLSTAIFYLDKQMTTPYYNLTFFGNKQTPLMTPDSTWLIFPPCIVGQKISRAITVKLEGKSDLESFDCVSKDEPKMDIRIMSHNISQEGEDIYTIVTINILFCSKIPDAKTFTVTFHHTSGASCDVEVSYCFTYCPLTLHTHVLVDSIDNPYPFYPENTESKLYEYSETCLSFLGKWMFLQGFRRDLYPKIPDTFHALSSTAPAPHSVTKGKSINASYLHFIKRIAGPVIKHMHKISIVGVDDTFKQTKETHDTYKEIINLLLCRGAKLWTLDAKFLLSYDQFVIYNDNVTQKRNADIILTKELLNDMDLYRRLNKQCWMDFILQTYKVFVVDSCFFECVCKTTSHRDIIQIITDWYNEQIQIRHVKQLDHESSKVIKNLTSDLSDGIAIITSFLNYCPFLHDYFSVFIETPEDGNESEIIHNACLIIEAMNMLRLNFPLSSTDFLKPNFLQMLFLSIHLYVILPMLIPKDTVQFNPPLLRSSTRQIAISPIQESLTCTSILLNNINSNFIIEKTASGESGKKIYVTITYTANFVKEETVTLLVHGYNKMRIFDTYMVFMLHGQIQSHSPLKKCKVSGPIYRPSKVDVQLISPFSIPAIFKLIITDAEPSIPVKIENDSRPQLYIRRLNLVDTNVNLPASTKESGQDIVEQKVHLQIICLSAQIKNSWIWFRSNVGEFYIKVTTQPKWDFPIDTLEVTLNSWPMEPCSCGEACECYRTTLVVLPHRNELMVNSLRYALLEYASEEMMEVFNKLIETKTGRIILRMLLAESGTDMTEVEHILRCETTYLVSSRNLLTRTDYVTMQLHTPATTSLVLTVPAHNPIDKYSVILTSECGMDIRTYKITLLKAKACGEN